MNCNVPTGATGVAVGTGDGGWHTQSTTKTDPDASWRIGTTVALRRAMILRNVALMGTLGVAVAALGACSPDAEKKANDGSAPSGENAADNVETVRSAQQRDTNPSLSGAEQETLAKGEAAFAVDIFRAVAKGAKDDNVFLSPHSISIALGMTYAGARGETAAEMKKVLHLDLPDDRVHTGFNYLDLQLASRGSGASGKDGSPFRLNVANSIWGQKGFSFETPFLDTLAINYGAGMNIVDFEKETDKARLAINGWVEKKTEDRIKDLLPEGALPADTRVVLVNAVYFNAGWRSPFTEGATAPASFTKVDGSTVDVPTMHVVTHLQRASGEDYDAIELPYDGNELSMLAIAPKAGTYAAFEAALTGEKVLDILAGLSSSYVDLAFPKLKAEASFALKEPLQDLGMKKAFDDADLSGMSTTTQLVIAKVVHKTFLSLDEKGTEAAAATAVVAVPTSLPPEPVKVNIDRPFITAIVDKQTKTLVFLGRILEPKN